MDGRGSGEWGLPARDPPLGPFLLPVAALVVLAPREGVTRPGRGRAERPPSGGSCRRATFPRGPARDPAPPTPRLDARP